VTIHNVHQYFDAFDALKSPVISNKNLTFWKYLRADSYIR